jgi:hypothetical protein
VPRRSGLRQPGDSDKPVTEDGGEEGRKHAGEVANSFWGSEREEACWSSPYTAAQSGGGDSTTVGWMKGGGAGEVVSEPHGVATELRDVVVASDGDRRRPSTGRPSAADGVEGNR